MIETFRDLEQNLALLNLNEAARDEVRDFVLRNWKRVASLSAQAYQGEIPDYAICRLKPLSRLAVWVWKLSEVSQKYLALGVPEAVFSDTAADISLRQRLYYEKTGKPGLSRGDCIWFRHLENAQIFKVGVLQFQPFEMLYLEKKADGSGWFSISDRQKASLPAGSRVVNVHIQKGTDIDPEKVAESFALARRLFTKLYPEVSFNAFVCYSWLLHPGLIELLPEHSRILKFAEFFEIIGVSGDREQAIERIFGKRFRSRAHFPQETSLQKAALARMDLLGYAIGVVRW